MNFLFSVTLKSLGSLHFERSVPIHDFVTLCIRHWESMGSLSSPKNFSHEYHCWYCKSLYILGSWQSRGKLRFSHWVSKLPIFLELTGPFHSFSTKYLPHAQVWIAIDCLFMALSHKNCVLWKRRQVSWLEPLLGELIFRAGNSLGDNAQPKITRGAYFSFVTQKTKKTCPQGLLFIKTIYCQFIKGIFKHCWHLKILQDF